MLSGSSDSSSSILCLLIVSLTTNAKMTCPDWTQSEVVYCQSPLHNKRVQVRRALRRVKQILALELAHTLRVEPACVGRCQTCLSVLAWLVARCRACAFRCQTCVDAKLGGQSCQDCGAFFNHNTLHNNHISSSLPVVYRARKSLSS